jgi:4-hydroxy-2-oxoheptanedioate aldolase
MLDIGAMGLLIPFIKTVDEIRDVVGYGKYPPTGERGCGFGRKSGYGMESLAAGNIEDYFKWANENQLLIPQCETVECLECIEDVAAIDGVDGIFIGPFDLSVSMGIPKQFTNPKFTAALERVLKACKAANKFCFTLGMTPEDCRKRFEQGFDGTLTGDTTFLISGVSQYLSGLKAIGY